MKILEKNIFATSSDRNSINREEFIIKREKESFNKDLLDFGFDYFDNDKNGFAYNGYFYDGRYEETAKHFCKLFNLKNNDTLLEIGCAKGFLLKSFLNCGLNAYGLDYSEYAVKNCHPDLQDKIFLGDCSNFKTYPNISPDFIISKETLPHLKKVDIKSTIKNMNRIIDDDSRIVIQIQYVENNKEKDQILSFDPTHKTLQSKEQWIKDLEDFNYNGYVHFKRLFY